MINIINEIILIKQSLNIIIAKEMSSSFTRKKIQSYSYGLNDVIGKGYSSQVYKGRNDDTADNVAVKVIDLRLLKNQINKILLQSEILILKELKALPHILTLHEVYTTKNNTYIITELCDSDLSKIVKKGLTEEESVAYMQQVIAGYLNFARKQIIHRDLKPANILVTDKKILKIADFGFAIKVVDALKSTKYNVGSPLYMAPESLRKNEYTLKTDIWALGVIFFEMLTGETPWKAKNEKELIKKIQSERLEDILGKYSFSNSTKQFLKKTLKIDKMMRMDMDQLSQFTFTPQNLSILTEKKLNSQSKHSNMSLHHISTFTPKVDRSTENNRLFIDRTNENRAASRDISVNKFSSFKNEPINQSLQLKPNYGHKFSPAYQPELKKRDSSKFGKENPENTIVENYQNNKIEPKLEKKAISKILVSEIHFCRFLYKLLGKIIESGKKGLLQNLSSEVEAIVMDYVGIIKHKIDNLVSFSSQNFLNIQGYEEYKEGGDYTKLMKIAKEYKERYSNELKPYWIGTKYSFSNSSTYVLINSMIKLLKSRENNQDFIGVDSKEIIILDYLITSKQLIDIFKNGENFEKFAKKSRIEEIVQGKTVDISWELYLKIMMRAREVTEIESNSGFVAPDFSEKRLPVYA